MVSRRPVGGKRAATEKSNPPSAKKKSTAAVWAAAAILLARWALAGLVNRSDVRVRYLRPEERTATQTVRVRRGKVTRKILRRHFAGADVGDLVGLHALALDNTCRWIAVEVNGNGEVDAGLKKANRRAALALYERAHDLGFTPLLVSSDGKGGYHLVVLFSTPIPSERAHAFAAWLVCDWKGLGLTERPETYPRNEKLGGEISYGSWLRLPGRHPTRQHYPQVWTGKRWAKGQDAIDAILATTTSDPARIPAEASSYREPEPVREAESVEDESEATPRRRGVVKEVTPVEKVLVKLKNVLPSSNGWSARCPAHNDTQNSLSIAEGDDGRVLLKCHAGCHFEEVVRAMDLGTSEMFARHTRRRQLRHPRAEE